MIACIMDPETPSNQAAIEREVAEFARELSMHDATEKFTGASQWYIDLAKRARAYQTLRRKDCEPLESSILRVAEEQARNSFLELVQTIVDEHDTFEERVAETSHALNSEMKSRHEQMEMIFHPYERPPKYLPEPVDEFVEAAFLFNEDSHETMMEELSKYYLADIVAGTNEVIEKCELYSPGERRLRTIKKMGRNVLRFIKMTGEQTVHAFAITENYIPSSSQYRAADQPHMSPLWRSDRRE